MIVQHPDTSVQLRSPLPLPPHLALSDPSQPPSLIWKEAEGTRPKSRGNPNSYGSTDFFPPQSEPDGGVTPSHPSQEMRSRHLGEDRAQPRVDGQTDSYTQQVPGRFLSLPPSCSLRHPSTYLSPTSIVPSMKKKIIHEVQLIQPIFSWV